MKKKIKVNIGDGCAFPLLMAIALQLVWIVTLLLKIIELKKQLGQ